ncbi:MAG: putative endonuclease lcl3 [Sarcosagium campestre]|nr:MAG: putative endonuclease lcl3 [Sarcosagium campestre]
MRWPPWSSSNSSEDESIHATEKKKEKKKNAAISWNNSLNAIDWAHYTEPRNLTAVALLTATTLALVHLWRSRLRRIPGAGSIQPNFFRKRSLFGTVTSVGDGDGFRLFHTPGGRLTGWGWIPGRKVPEKRDDLRDRTISVRLAGIDAPEMAHFGRPAQPYSNEAYNWLRDYISGRRVRAYIYKRDQYDRVVATVYVRRGLLRRDVGLQMLKHGLATVYEAKSGAEFGVLENKYRSAEWWAKKRRKGMWGSKSALESPREYKTRVGKEEAGKT